MCLNTVSLYRNPSLRLPSEMHPHYFIRVNIINRGNSSLWLICFLIQFMSNREVDFLCSISFLEMIYLEIKQKFSVFTFLCSVFLNCYICVVYYLLFKDTFSICFPLFSSKRKIITAILFRKFCLYHGINIFLSASRNYCDQCNQSGRILCFKVFMQ